MPAARFRLVLFCISGFVSAGLWILGFSLSAARERQTGEGLERNVPRYGFAVLICGTAVPDQELRERLRGQGFTGLISESSQWVLLDSFGSIDQVSLDKYSVRLLPFDPRNDGYGEKIRSLFVRDNKRLVYIPLTSPAAEQLEKKLELALDGIPYSVEYNRNNTPLNLPMGFLLALFCCAVCTFVAIRPLRMVVKPYTVSLIPCLPLLAPLSAGGAAGFAMTGLLAGFAVLVVGPWFEMPVAPRANKLSFGGQPSRGGLVGVSDRTDSAAYTAYRLLPLLMVICYGILAFFSNLSPVFAALVFILFCGMLAVSRWGASCFMVFKSMFRGWGVTGFHRFAPVLILNNRLSLNFVFSWVILPFAVIAFALVCAGLAMPDREPADFSMLPPAGTLTKADYDAHCLFQLTFSLRSLNAVVPDDTVPGMGVYEFATDGLPVQNNIPADQSQLSNLPPFPLSDLIQYLEAADRDSDKGHRDFAVSELLTAALPFLFIFPALFRKHARKRGTRPAGSSPLLPARVVKPPLSTP